MIKRFSRPIYRLIIWTLRVIHKASQAILNALFNFFIIRKFVISKGLQGHVLGIHSNAAIGVQVPIVLIYAEQNQITDQSSHSRVTFLTYSNPANVQLELMIRKSIAVIVDDEIAEKLEAGGWLYPFMRSKFIKHIDDCWRLPSLEFTRKTIFFSASETQRGWELLIKIGIRPSDRFATVHCRSDTYYDNQGTIMDFARFRNSSFENLSDSIRFLSEANIKVIRTGTYSDEPNPNYLSLNCFSKAERDFLDIFVQYHCFLAINGCSGLGNVPALFEKPILWHNIMSADVPPPIRKGILLFKKAYDKKSGRFLDFMDLRKIKILEFQIEHGLPTLRRLRASKFQAQSLYDRSNIVLKENTSEDLLHATKELVSLAEGTLTLSKDQITLQNQIFTFFPNGYRMDAENILISPHYLMSRAGTP